MSPRSRGARRIAEALTSTASKSSTTHVCRSCRAALSLPFQTSRSASTATANATAQTLPITQVSSSSPEASPAPQPSFTIKAGVVVSRPPLITPDPHPFETAYYLYQRRLNERLVLPFTQYFYYKRNTPALETWRSNRRARGGAAARDIGKYDAHNTESWNDEVLVGDESGSPVKIVEQLIAEEGRAEEFTGAGDAKFAGLRRRTEADEKNDQKSLERSLSRTLYLLVKSKTAAKGQNESELWKFPAGTLVGKEGLKEAAQRILFATCGVNMNTFFVGNHPVGHYIQSFSSPRKTASSSSSSSSAPTKTTTDAAKAPALPAQTQASAPTEPTLVDGEKTFFMKARILAGQADLSITQDQDVEDFKWVSKDEVEKLVAPEYWIKVKNMLVAQ